MSKLVILTVTSYDPATRAGSAVTAEGEPVILRTEQARRASGTYRNPIITTRPADAHLTIGRETPTRLAALIEQGGFGAVATSWAVLPPVDWYDELIASGTRTRYIGGRVEITRHDGGADSSGSLTDLTLADGKLRLYIRETTGPHAGIAEHPLRLDAIELITDAPAGCFSFRSPNRRYTLLAAVPATAAVH